MTRLVATAGAALVSATLAGAAPVGAQEGVATGWPYVGSDQAHSKYSTAEEITSTNVGELDIAWRRETGATPLPEYCTRPGPF